MAFPGRLFKIPAKLTPAAYTADASLIHPDFGDEPVAGKIFVSQLRLQFQSDPISIEIPTDSLEVQFEEAGNGIFFCDATQPDVKIFTRTQSILLHPVIKTVPQVASALARRELVRAVRLSLYFVGGCILVAWIASLLVSAMGRAIAARVPMEWEQKTGLNVIERLQKNGLFLNDSNGVAQLASFAEPLIHVLPEKRRNVKFYIADDSDPNAFALPGGYVVVNSGLLRMLSGPELLGVLAHELAHLTKRHAVRRQIAAAGPLVIFGVFLHTDSGVGNLLTAGSGLMVYQGFSQDYETEADDMGWNYLLTANIDPRGMIEAFQKLQEWERKQHMAGVPQAFQSHPATEKRIKRLEEKWRSVSRKSGFRELPPFQWTNPGPSP